MNTILGIERLCAGYGGASVLSDVNLKVKAGQIVALIGANGAGKTTMMNVVAGALRPTAGRVVVAGEALRQTSSSPKLVRTGVVLVPEGRHVFGSMTVDENLQLGAYLRRAVDARRDREYVLELFPRLRERLTQPAGTMSGGEQQMLAIGRALMAGPKLLLLDEPTLGLAPLVVDVIASALKQLNEKGLSILIVEQNAIVALGLAHFAYLMESGKITINGVPSNLLNDERVRAAYLGGSVSVKRESTSSQSTEAGCAVARQAGF